MKEPVKFSGERLLKPRAAYVSEFTSPRVQHPVGGDGEEEAHALTGHTPDLLEAPVPTFKVLSQRKDGIRLELSGGPGGASVTVEVFPSRPGRLEMNGRLCLRENVPGWVRESVARALQTKESGLGHRAREALRTTAAEMALREYGTHFLEGDLRTLREAGRPEHRCPDAQLCRLSELHAWGVTSVPIDFDERKRFVSELSISSPPLAEVCAAGVEPGRECFAMLQTPWGPDEAVPLVDDRLLLNEDAVREAKGRLVERLARHGALTAWQLSRVTELSLRLLRRLLAPVGPGTLVTQARDRAENERREQLTRMAHQLAYSPEQAPKVEMLLEVVLGNAGRVDVKALANRLRLSRELVDAWLERGEGWDARATSVLEDHRGTVMEREGRYALVPAATTHERQQQALSVLRLGLEAALQRLEEMRVILSGGAGLLAWATPPPAASGTLGPSAPQVDDLFAQLQASGLVGPKESVEAWLGDWCQNPRHAERYWGDMRDQLLIRWVSVLEQVTRPELLQASLQKSEVAFAPSEVAAFSEALGQALGRFVDLRVARASRGGPREDTLWEAEGERRVYDPHWVAAELESLLRTNPEALRVRVLGALEGLEAASAQRLEREESVLDTRIPTAFSIERGRTEAAASLSGAGAWAQFLEREFVFPSKIRSELGRARAAGVDPVQVIDCLSLQTLTPEVATQVRDHLRAWASGDRVGQQVAAKNLLLLAHHDALGRQELEGKFEVTPPPRSRYARDDPPRPLREVQGMIARSEDAQAVADLLGVSPEAVLAARRIPRHVHPLAAQPNPDLLMDWVIAHGMRDTETLSRLRIDFLALYGALEVTDALHGGDWGRLVAAARTCWSGEWEELARVRRVVRNALLLRVHLREDKVTESDLEGWVAEPWAPWSKPPLEDPDKWWREMHDHANGPGSLHSRTVHGVDGEGLDLHALVEPGVERIHAGNAAALLRKTAVTPTSSLPVVVVGPGAGTRPEGPAVELLKDGEFCEVRSAAGDAVSLRLRAPGKLETSAAYVDAFGLVHAQLRFESLLEEVTHEVMLSARSSTRSSRWSPGVAASVTARELREADDALGSVEHGLRYAKLRREHLARKATGAALEHAFAEYARKEGGFSYLALNLRSLDFRLREAAPQLPLARAELRALREQLRTVSSPSPPWLDGRQGPGWLTRCQTAAATVREWFQANAALVHPVEQCELELEGPKAAR